QRRFESLSLRHKLSSIIVSICHDLPLVFRPEGVVAFIPIYANASTTVFETVARKFQSATLMRFRVQSVEETNRHGIISSLCHPRGRHPSKPRPKYRPRGAIHQRGIYEPSREAGHHDQHGRPRTSDRQHFHRAFMADGEKRKGVCEGLRRRVGSGLQSQKLFHFLQSRTPASVVGLSDAGGDLLWESEIPLRRGKAAYAVGRPSCRSSFLGDPGAKFLCGKLERSTKKEK